MLVELILIAILDITEQRGSHFLYKEALGIGSSRHLILWCPASLVFFECILGFMLLGKAKSIIESTFISIRVRLTPYGHITELRDEYPVRYPQREQICDVLRKFWEKRLTVVLTSPTFDTFLVTNFYFDDVYRSFPSFAQFSFFFVLRFSFFLIYFIDYDQYCTLCTSSEALFLYPTFRRSFVKSRTASRCSLMNSRSTIVLF